MKQVFNIQNSYSYVKETSTASQIRQMGVECAQGHGRVLRDAAERAVCRFYQVPSLSDCNADHILASGNHHYEGGVPFAIVDLADNQFIIQDLRTKRCIFATHRFNVEREEFEQRTISEAFAVNLVTIVISQGYTTFDNVK